LSNFEIPNKRTLEYKYLKEEKPMHKIAKEMNMSVGKVYKFIKQYQIPTRKHEDVFTMKERTLSDMHRMKISEIHKGKKLSEETKKKISEANKKGGIGSKKVRADGYIAIYFPDHPKSSADGYIMEHILVLESLIGRHLKDNECVHHINQNKQDNRKENLQLMTKTEHMSYHSKKRWEEHKNAQ
jgi:hypothetical protein